MFKFLKKRKDNVQTDAPVTKQGVFATLASGLRRTRDSLIGGVASIFGGKQHIDEELLSQLEEKLLLADVGFNVTEQIINTLKAKLKREKSVSTEIAMQVLQSQLEEILLPCSRTLPDELQAKPFVILFVGVNGSGKTTTIGKLAKQLQLANNNVMLAAGDTFRAAAIEQLKIWGERNHIPIIAQQQGSDSAAVLYDAMQAAKARNIDVLIADTAGRLHTQHNLMTELQKIKRTMQKVDPTAPHEIILILDATTGQNALNQAKQFHEAVGVTGLCITKLDGTAKGGVIFAIAQALKLPIYFIGVGESIDDLKPFDAKEFVSALFSPIPN